MKISRKKNKGLAQKRRNGKTWLKVVSSGIVEEIFKKIYAQEEGLKVRLKSKRGFLDRGVTSP